MNYGKEKCKKKLKCLYTNISYNKSVLDPTRAMFNIFRLSSFSIEPIDRKFDMHKNEKKGTCIRFLKTFFYTGLILIKMQIFLNYQPLIMGQKEKKRKVNC